MANTMFMGFEGLSGNQGSLASRKVAFGTGEINRPLYPNQIPHDRFGNEMTPFRGVRTVGPGQYENHETTAFTNLSKPMSLRGYILGARTAKKEAYQIKIRAPSPTHYQNEEKIEPKPSFKPFNSSDTRFQKEYNDTKPGPGTYEFNVERNRSVKMLHSFGGRAKSVPHVNIRCTAYGTSSIKCENCTEKPVGDFYQFKNSVLCQRCYEYNYKWQERYERSYLSSFKKTRDCSFLHEHEGTTAVIQKVSEKELRKLKRKEAYLSLYWP